MNSKQWVYKIIYSTLLEIKQVKVTFTEILYWYKSLKTPAIPTSVFFHSSPSITPEQAALKV